MRSRNGHVNNRRHGVGVYVGDGGPAEAVQVCRPHKVPESEQINQLTESQHAKGEEPDDAGPCQAKI
jgi:hypothetical protein